MKLNKKWLQKIIREELNKIVSEGPLFPDTKNPLSPGDLSLDPDIANAKTTSGPSEPERGRRRRRSYDEPRRAGRGGKFVRPQRNNPSTVADAVRSWNPYSDRDMIELHPEEEQYAKKRFDALKSMLTRMYIDTLPDYFNKSSYNVKNLMGASIDVGSILASPQSDGNTRMSWALGSALFWMSQTYPDLFEGDGLEYLQSLYTKKYAGSQKLGFFDQGARSKRQIQYTMKTVKPYFTQE
jgi:hypothetical protein